MSWEDDLDDKVDDLLEDLGVFEPSHEVYGFGCFVVIMWVGATDDVVIDGIDVLLFVFEEVRLAVRELKDWNTIL